MLSAAVDACRGEKSFVSKGITMVYFPMFYTLDNKKILLVGGGSIATEKLEKLLEFSKEITVITKELSAECNTIIKEHCLTLYQRPYVSGDIEGFDIVIVATDTTNLHESIFLESRGKNILVNSVDNTKYCDFIFPSFIKRGDLTVAFSTSGASPAFAKYIRRYFERMIPQGVEEFLEKLKSLRKTEPKGKERMKRFDSLVKEYFKKEFK